MKHIGIFPWVAVNQPIAINEFEIIYFKNGILPADKDQNAMKEIASLHKIHTTFEIREASFLKYKDEILISKLEEEDIQKIFTFSELFAFAALSERRFFTNNYINKTSFEFYIYPYTDDSKLVSINSRKRDGEKNTVFPLNLFTKIKPDYCGNNPSAINLKLIDGILNYSEQVNSDHLLEAINIFNLANTDSNQLRNSVEITLLLGSIERLYKINNGNKSDLISKISRYLIPKNRVNPKDCQRVREKRKKSTYKTLTEEWIMDFRELRGEYAHGRLYSKQPSVWSLDEHVLYSSYIFPLLVKLALSEYSFYQLSEIDQNQIDVFEELLCIKPVVGNDSAISKFVWNDVINKF
ncbi:hypothetical protein EHQ58_15550 [Leptospira ognonensis]|uniref:Apea-like HEPN domain-containing protein n=1 Tax=Leptospira ognonensis TaxID=2484945 RepID=A0A4R9JWU6_9LEPT|nr:hypothetical protein [Leptospira ognonensis]TGL56977.1 hypothetical protein EHQ58_15550 [Leptospira ognonensis]